jgi:[acyl-carrier-protein] S-malonyltransferase
LLDADADELVQTHNAQLATFLTSLITLDAVERTGVEPARVAGHSLGEYTALVAAGAVSFEDGVRLVSERGAAMKSAADAQNGTMAAVLGLDDDKVEMACARVDGDVWVANFNSPGQVVIAGDPEAIEAAGAAAKELGAKRVMGLPVGGAFHTPFMAPARDNLRKALDLAEWRDPEVPVHANVDALPHPDGAAWAGLLSAQLCSPVRWRQTLQQLGASGVTTIVEVGPGTVLTGMAKRTLSGSHTLSVGTPDDLDHLLEVLAGTPATDVADDHGEHLFMTERLVVSPGAGVFRRLAGTTDAGHRLAVGDPVGTVGDREVRSPFAGILGGVLAIDGERITPRQPVAWLRSEPSSVSSVALTDEAVAG